MYFTEELRLIYAVDLSFEYKINVLFLVMWRPFLSSCEHLTLKVYLVFLLDLGWNQSKRSSLFITLLLTKRFNISASCVSLLPSILAVISFALT